MSPQFIFYNPDANTLLTYFLNVQYGMFLIEEQCAGNTEITVTQLMGRTSFTERLNKERDSWVYVGQI